MRGLHEPIVTQELFDRVQAILDGKKPLTPARRKVNPEFPLRRLVRCQACGSPLTGAHCKGRNNRYPRYWCRQRGCRAVSLPKAHLESEFQTFLGRLQVNKDKTADFPKIAAKVWEAKQGSAQRESKKLTTQLEEQKKLKSNLLNLRMEGEISKDEFEEANAAFRVKIHAIEERLQGAASTKAKADSFVRFAELQVMDMAHVWRIASPEQRERVQNLLFEGGLEYSSKSGFLNRSESSLFNALGTIDFRKDDLVDLIGIEPMTSSMPWKRAPSCATGPLLRTCSFSPGAAHQVKRGRESAETKADSAVSKEAEWASTLPPAAQFPSRSMMRPDGSAFVRYGRLNQGSLDSCRAEGLV